MRKSTQKFIKLTYEEDNKIISYVHTKKTFMPYTLKNFFPLTLSTLSTN